MAGCGARAASLAVYEMIATEALTRIIANHLPCSWLPDPRNAEVGLLAEGAYHSSFLVVNDGQRSVARVCRASQWGFDPRLQLRREFEALRDLAPSGVTPTPREFIDGDPPVLIESFVDGGSFGYGDPVAIAETIARCHRQPVSHATRLLESTPPLEHLLLDGRKRLERLERSGPHSQVVKYLEAAANTLDASAHRAAVGHRIVHTDLIHTNILESSVGLRVIDWEGVRLGPAEWDLAYFLSPVTLTWAPAGAPMVDGTWLEEFLGAYAAATDSDLALLTRGVAELLPAVVFRALCWCVEFRSLSDPLVELDPRLAKLTDPYFVAETLRSVRVTH